MPLTTGTVYSSVSVDNNAAVVADVDAAVAAATGLRLMGYSVRESAATPAAAALNIVNGATGAGGAPLARIKLAANESRTVWLWPGIAADAGLSIDWIAGTVDVDLYYATIT